MFRKATEHSLPFANGSSCKVSAHNIELNGTARNKMKVVGTGGTCLSEVGIADLIFRLSASANQLMYEACPESKNTPHVGREGNFLCLLWQHCRRPWSFTCEPCSFDSGRTGFVWVRRVWNGSADPKSRHMRGAFRHTISQRKRWTSSWNSQTDCFCLW